MKFLIHIPQLIFAGAEKVLVSFANCLVEHGHEVEILETYERGLLKAQFDPRVTFHAICSQAYTQKYYASMAQIRTEAHPLKKLALCGKKAFSVLVGYERFARHLARKHYAHREFDVAINYLESEDPAFILDAIQAKKRFQWIHTDPSRPETKPEIDQYAPQYVRMDRIFCVSEYAAQQFRLCYPNLAEKTGVMYNFFDAHRILEQGAAPYAYPSQRPVLLCVGRMTPPKKYLRFLSVLGRLRDAGYAFSWHVLGVGGEYEQILEKIAALHLKDRVFLHGQQENPYCYMAGCDLFVLPSGWEGFPTVTVEAKLLGCPVLATDVSGIREQLIHGETGWIVENSEEAIFEGLKYLLDHPEIVQSLRSAAGIQKITAPETKYEELMRYV